MRGAARASLSGDVLRCVHYNVRRCIDPASGESSRERVVSTIASLRPHILSLNEVDIEKTPTLLDELGAIGLKHSAFFGHVRNGTYGNALLSTEPFDRVERTHLDGGTVVRTKSGGTHRIARGLLSARFTVLGVHALLAVTHLDHMDAAERAEQMRHVLRVLDAGATTTTTLLLGDLNALSRADYTADEWQAHAAHNAARGWAAPHDDASADGALARLGGAGFVDCAASVAHRPTCAWPTPPWTAHLRAAGPHYRIDYCWLRSSSRPQGRSLVPLAAHVEPAADASDHQPLVVDLEAISFDAGE